MSEGEGLSIGEVVARTGLTERALRLYEKKGLVFPPRSAGGRRLYRSEDLERIHQIRVLSRSGFSLAQIGELFASEELHAQELLDVQIESFSAEVAILEHRLRALEVARDAVAAGERIDVEMLCTLIQTGEAKMNNEAWRKFYDKHYSPEQQAQWKSLREQFFGPSFDRAQYNRKWRELGRRIDAALPLSPEDPRAQAFLDEWNALTGPLAKLVDESKTFQAEAARIEEDLESWPEPEGPPFTREVLAFIQRVQEVRDRR